MEEWKLLNTQFAGKMPDIKQTKTFLMSDGTINTVETMIHFTVIDTKQKKPLPIKARAKI